MPHKATTLAIAINTILLTASCTTKQYQPTKPLSQQMVEAHGLGDFDCNTNHKDSLSTTGWDYVSGLVANAVLKTWEQYPEHKEYFKAVKAFADYNTSENGDSIFKMPKRISAIGESNIDDLAAGKIYFTLYHESLRQGDSISATRYKTAVTMLRNKLKYHHSRIAEGNAGAGGFFHKAQYPSQMWLDGLYMGPALYAQWQHEFGIEEGVEANMESWTDIAKQFIILHQQTYDSVKQLNYHGWSSIPEDENSFWANQTEPHKGCSKEFWGRGMGWYFAALCDILEWMPQEHPNYSTLYNNFNQVAKGLARWQDKATGLWFQLLQYDETTHADNIGDNIEGTLYNIGNQRNYIESSASSMYTYVFFKGVRLGFLDKSQYLPIAQKAYNGLLENIIIEKEGKIGIKNICASAGLGPKKDPSRTGTRNYYLAGHDTKVTENEGKAIGPFIMASLEKELIK